MEKPNILWLVLDTLRADRVGCYGYRWPVTPTLDRLAAEGLRVQTAIAQGGFSLPSYATMLTGLYPSEHGAEQLTCQLNPDTPTLPELLQGCGYATASIGTNGFLPTGFGLERGFQSVQFLHPGSVKVISDENGPVAFGEVSAWPVRRRYLGLSDCGAGHVNAQTMRFIREHRDQPWFAFVHYMETHEPYTPPLSARLAACRLFGYRVFNPMTIRHMSSSRRLQEGGDAVWATVEQLLAACTYYLDSQIARLLAFLERERLADNTIVIVCGDHGNFLGERGLYGHEAMLGEPLCHVPLIIRAPGHIAPGSTAGGVAELRDVPHTLSRLAGVTGLSEGDRPASDLCQAAAIPADRVAYAERKRMTDARARKIQAFMVGENGAHNRTLRMVRDQEWEYLEYEDGQRELFNILRDPAEQHDLSAAEPAVTERLAAAMRNIVAGLQTSQGVQEADLAPEVEERLRALGYL